ncbi:lipopolysaccharide-induced tumor necrosis factor-alpha factor homolog isoform X1 [Xyrichtys novacula]|uniref:Lipopolysaccharide-induced tumor necrosis factor-alpha factor homolog isoform X1 n=1 Tax=Xyrichtys novacula TaxID=13765 RepID=A0AAV1EZF5_XYRNO|nr:lipopolysaccharide-induced tumor necrosis factor-alpha factor homolog isoform X1 [Xyrichtys novacula]
MLRMESLSKVDEPFPTPPPYFLPDESQTGHHVSVYHIHSPFTPPPPPSFSFSPGVACSTQNNTPVQGALSTPRPKFVSYETQLHRYPALTTCPSCQTQVTTQVTYQVAVWMLSDPVFCEPFQGRLSHVSPLPTGPSCAQEDLL